MSLRYVNCVYEKSTIHNVYYRFIHLKADIPSYFVALDFSKKKIVITIKGAESLKESLTKMQWNSINIPNVDPSLEWHGNEEIIKAALLLKEELKTKKIIEKCLDYSSVYNR